MELNEELCTLCKTLPEIQTEVEELDTKREMLFQRNKELLETCAPKESDDERFENAMEHIKLSEQLFSVFKTSDHPQVIKMVDELETREELCDCFCSNTDLDFSCVLAMLTDDDICEFPLRYFARRAAWKDTGMCITSRGDGENKQIVSNSSAWTKGDGEEYLPWFPTQLDMISEDWEVYHDISVNTPDYW